jgi:hypothetical protein
MAISRLYNGFRLDYDPQTGNVLTRYSDGSECMVWANAEDRKHAAVLGITPGEHKILHEIIHQQLAFAMGNKTCPIVWAQAHLEPMKPSFLHLEGMIMALTYMALQVPMPHEDWWNKIASVQSFCNPYELLKDIRQLYQYYTKR